MEYFILPSFPNTTLNLTKGSEKNLPKSKHLFKIKFCFDVKIFGTNKWYHVFPLGRVGEVSPSKYNKYPNEIFFDKSNFLSLSFVHKLHFTARIKKQSTCLKISLLVEVALGNFPVSFCSKHLVLLTLSASFSNLLSFHVCQSNSILLAL